MKTIKISIENSDEEKLIFDLNVNDNVELEDIQKSIETFGKSVCAYCGEWNTAEPAVVLEHIMTCEKRPERVLSDKAFEVEDRLYKFLNHLTGENSKIKLPGFLPHGCTTCGEIAELLRIYNSAEE